MRFVEYVSCNKCGWVHLGVSREEAIEQVNAFNFYFDSLKEEERIQYYGNTPASIEEYSACSRCGNDWKDFRRTLPEEVPDGSTIGAILFDAILADEKRD
jgi:rubredoxin